MIQTAGTLIFAALLLGALFLARDDLAPNCPGDPVQRLFAGAPC